MLNIRRSRDRLIFNMGSPILVRRHLYIETVPRIRYQFAFGKPPIYHEALYVLFVQYYMARCEHQVDKGIKNGCPCIVEIRGTQGCALVGDARAVGEYSQGTTLTDLHNARATILNPFYNMEHKIIKKIRQNMTWIKEDILGINLTPNRYNALVPAIVYVSNDVTIPFNSVTSQ